MNFSRPTRLCVWRKMNMVETIIFIHFHILMKDCKVISSCYKLRNFQNAKYGGRVRMSAFVGLPVKHLWSSRITDQSLYTVPFLQWVFLHPLNSSIEKNIGLSNDVNDNTAWWLKRLQFEFSCSYYYWYFHMHSVLTRGCGGTWCCRRDGRCIFIHTPFSHYVKPDNVSNFQLLIM